MLKNLIVVSITFINTAILFSQTTFIVNSTGDGVDNHLSDGICNDGFGDCTLRAAIEQANFTYGTDTILFEIAGVGPHTIQPNYAFPDITESIVIDGTSEPDFDGSLVVEINGSSAGVCNGLSINSGGSVIKGLVINRFFIAGIEAVNYGGNTIVGNYIGTDVTGTVARPNEIGIYAVSNSSGNQIGGIEPETRNIISGNNDAAIYVGDDASNNIIQGNYIGTDVTGTISLGGNGISVASPDNLIGGTEPGAGNLISGTIGAGIWIGDDSPGSERNIIQGNLIGTDITGTIALPNEEGIVIIAANNTVGGTTEGAGNVISGNTNNGIGIYAEVLLVSGNIITGNKIGTDITGTIALGNGTAGVTIVGASNNIVGGYLESERNIISGNEYGIVLDGRWNDVYATVNNSVLGNYIGTDITGLQAIGNYQGIIMTETENNVIGGVIAGEGNLISGNESIGINMWSLGSNNIVCGNYVGTDFTGTDTIPNGSAGISIRSGSSSNVIGGTDSGAGNLISGNYRGIAIGFSGAENNTVQGNLIGTDLTGQFPLGNAENGISIYGGASNNQIGGFVDNAENLIAYNSAAGICNNSLAISNRLARNSIFHNGELGIDLSFGSAPPYTDGRTPNDAGDADTGPNNLQNFPEISAAGIDENGDLIIDYLVDSDPVNSAYPIFVEFFKSDSNGSGQLYLQYDVYLNTDYTAGIKQFNLGNAGTAGIINGDLLVATASDIVGNTSEFSEMIVISAMVGLPLTVTDLPATYVLNQNYPNPFNPVTEIRYELPERSLVSLTVYDLLGRRINELVNEMQDAGYKSVKWNATDNQGQQVSAGMYLYQINVYDPGVIGPGNPSPGSGRNFVQTRKMIIIK
ncbi:MAG: T9SS type A sorting domain-containing protein [Candidatus Marinimicrobia bacterium]|nr:T9SS type A sorting domain-containing protein [Candidatus Neomarinimicrobiota bacterium]